MQFTVDIPDDIATLLQPVGGDLSRSVLETYALELYKSGRISNGQLSRMLGFGTVSEIDGFLKEHGIFHEYTVEDLERERDAFRSLGI